MKEVFAALWEVWPFVLFFILGGLWFVGLVIGIRSLYKKR